LIGNSDIPNGNSDIPYALGFLGNDAVVMGGAIDGQPTGRLHFWNTAQARLIKSPATGAVFCIVPNAERNKAAVWASRPAVGSGVKNHAFEIYDNQGKLLSSLTDSGREVRAAIFSPDLEWAVAGDDKGNIGIWDLSKQKRIGDESLWPLFENAYRDLGITSDKKLLVAADENGVVKVADLAKRAVLCSIAPHKSGVLSIVVSPDGLSFVTVSNDREIKTWSLDPAHFKDPKPTRTWILPTTANAVSYTPDSKQIVTANADGTAYLLQLP
jgi:WD40 repeat protein